MLIFFWIIIFIIIILVYMIRSYTFENIADDSTNTFNDSYTAIIEEVISLLEKLQKFYNKVSDFCGYVSVIPVNSCGDPYGIGSKISADRIQISLLFYEEVDEMLLDIISYHANEVGSDVLFQLNRQDGSTFYTATTFSGFHEKYKKFMPHLYEAVAKRFPDVKMKFDGSFISINHM